MMIGGSPANGATEIYLNIDPNERIAEFRGGENADVLHFHYQPAPAFCHDRARTIDNLSLHDIGKDRVHSDPA